MYPGKYATDACRPAVLHHGHARGEVVTYGEYEARTNRLAHLLRDHGLARLDHYSIFMENNPRYLEMCGAGERSGPVLHVRSTRTSPPTSWPTSSTTASRRVFITLAQSSSTSLDAVVGDVPEPSSAALVVDDGPSRRRAPFEDYLDGGRRLPRHADRRRAPRARRCSTRRARPGARRASSARSPTCTPARRWR